MEGLTPSQVLEHYDVLGRDVPKQLIDEMRARFQALELEGAHPWKILCDEIASINTKAGDDIDQDRLYVAQAVAEVLITPINTKVCLDQLSWRKRIAGLRSSDDYNNLFIALNVPEEVWQNSEELRKHNFQGLYVALREEFGSFQAFLATMEVEKNTWVAKVKRCEKDPEKLRYLFGVISDSSG